MSEYMYLNEVSSIYILTENKENSGCEFFNCTFCTFYFVTWAHTHSSIHTCICIHTQTQTHIETDSKLMFFLTIKQIYN